MAFTRKLKSLLFLAVIGSIAACGGGDEGSDSVGLTTTNVPIAVIDGPIKNATVCLDKNLNGSCDADDPTGITDVAGSTTLTVNNSDVGKYPILAVVDTSATDADTGPVTTRYVMKAPADATAVVSPLTTLVQNQAETFAQTTAQAVASVAQTTGLSESLIKNDYTKDTTESGRAAYAIAQAVVVAVQQQNANAKAAVGTTAIDGKTISQTDLDKAVTNAVNVLLPSIISDITSSSRVTGAASASDRLAALRVLLTPSFISSNGGISSPAGAQVAVGVNNNAASQASTSGSGYVASAMASLANFSYIDANHWKARISQKTLVEATLDANNTYKYRWGRYMNSGGGAIAWGPLGNSPNRGADLHWNGNAWVNCPVNFQHSQTVSDANGNATYNFCDGFEIGTVNSKAPTSATFDLTDQSIADGYLNKVQAANFTNLKIGDGTAASANSLLGSAKFPSGAKISYFTDTADSYAVSYYPSSGNPGKDNTVILASAIDAAGGDFTQAGSVQTACLTSTASKTPATKLDDLISRSSGKPCKYQTSSVAGLGGATLSSTEGGVSRNESWGNTTLSLGTIGTTSVAGTASSATTYYTGNTRLRVAFAANNVANFYTCSENYTGSARNCNLVSTGSYTINILSDSSRTLTFSGLPAVAAALGWNRVFVERNGLVYYGYQNLPSTSVSVRLNKVAMDALFAQLGLNSVSYFNGLSGGFDPAATISLSKLAYAGTYMGSINATGYVSGGFTITLNTDGTSTCSGTGLYVSPDTSGAAFTCTTTVVIVPGSTDTTIANLTVSTSDGSIGTATLSYYTGVISGGTWSNSKAGAVVSGTFTGSRL